MIDWYPLTFSFLVAAIATAVALVLAIFLAWLLARGRFWGRDLLDALLLVPLVLPPTVLGYYLLVLLAERSPLGALFVRVFGHPLTFTRAAAVLAATVHALPLLVKSLRVAFEAVDPGLEQAARSLGAGESRVFFSVTLPLSVRPLLAAVTLAFARALGDFGVTLMIAGNIPGRTQTAAVAIYDAVEAGRDHQAQLLAGCVTAIAALLLYTTNRLGRPRLVKPT